MIEEHNCSNRYRTDKGQTITEINSAFIIGFFFCLYSSKAINYLICQTSLTSNIVYYPATDVN